MPDISRAILLPPPSQFPQRTSAWAVQAESESIGAARDTRREPAGSAHAFLTLIDSRREDTVELKGKQFRFRPYTNRGAAEGGLRETDPSQQSGETEALSAAAEEDDAAVGIFDGFGAGARERNSSAFIASFIAQERLRQGLYNPQFEAASDAYRRAGGSPSAADNEPRLVSIDV